MGIISIFLVIVMIILISFVFPYKIYDYIKKKYKVRKEVVIKGIKYSLLFILFYLALFIFNALLIFVAGFAFAILSSTIIAISSAVFSVYLIYRGISSLDEISNRNILGFSFGFSVLTILLSGVLSVITLIPSAFIFGNNFPNLSFNYFGIPLHQLGFFNIFRSFFFVRTFVGAVAKLLFTISSTVFSTFYLMKYCKLSMVNKGIIIAILINLVLGIFSKVLIVQIGFLIYFIAFFLQQIDFDETEEKESIFE